MQNLKKINQLEQQLNTLIAQSDKSADEIAELKAQVAELINKLVALDCDRITDMFVTKL